MTKKFGTFQGVFVPSTEAILGTVLFLLMPLLSVDVGLPVMLLIIFLAHSVTISTAFSLADCATNLNRIEGGGMYALTKLSLGTALGGSIGIQLFLAQAASIGFYCIGFSEPLFPIIAPLLEKIPMIQGTTIAFQKHLIATFFCAVFFIIVMFGADFTLKIQMLILAVLGISIVTIFIAPLLPIEYQQKAVFSAAPNLGGARPLTIGIFFLTFTQFFPAVTGISTGIGMSGDLKNPKKSIVNGTFLAIFVTFVVYIIAAVVFSFLDRSLLLTGYKTDGSPDGIILTDLMGLNAPFPAKIPGLLILAGVLFATSSSALSVFMTAPRTAQFLAKDGIFPKYLRFLEKDFKSGGNEPRFAVIVSFAIGLAVIWMGSINFAAVIVGIMFLTVYGWVNGAAFLERASHNPGFRPTFKGHWAISLYGFISCLTAICLFNWYVGIAIFFIQFLVFWLILKFKTEGNLEGVWWGVLYTAMVKILKRLKNIVQGTKNWRPILDSYAYCTDNSAWEILADLSEKIASYQGMVHLNLIKSSKKFDKEIDISVSRVPTRIIDTNDPNQAILTLLQGSHMGGLEPNTVMMEFNPRQDNVRILKAVLNSGKNILMLVNGIKYKNTETLDIWWRGERNGNLMVLLAYIINRSLIEKKCSPFKIRVIRRLDRYEDPVNAHDSLEKLLRLARLGGEVVILPFDEVPFFETLENISSHSSLIMMGLPGNYIDMETSKIRLFKLDDFFFTKEINHYEKLPPILFIRSTKIMNITES